MPMINKNDHKLTMRKKMNEKINEKEKLKQIKFLKKLILKSI